MCLHEEARVADILTLPGASPLDDPARARVAAVLEAGGVVVLPDRPFPLSPEEQALADPAVLSPKAKNVSFDPATGRLSGHALEGGRLETLAAMTQRYAAFAEALLGELAPGYAAAAARRRTSFRPGAIDTRALSPRKDDKRLHVDAFPSSPVQGRRILRVFTNVDPGGAERVWRIAEGGFERYAAHFRPRLKGKSRLELAALERLGVTRGRRTPYDQAMLELHDLAKLDERWQADAPRREFALPAGASWMVFTDGAPHAAMRGRNAFEQTWLMPVAGMRDAGRSPLRILERMLERPLV